MDGSWPCVSVVFLAYNRREELTVSLERVQELEYPADRLEVIVVDNASTDGTADMVRERFPDAQLIRLPENVGISGFNVGVSSARGAWLLLLDDDCYMQGGSLELAVRAAEAHDADLVSFLVASSESDGLFNYGTRGPGLLGFVGCAVMLSRRAAEPEPVYDPNIFIWGNELELTMRVLDRGYRHLYLPEVVAVHQKPITEPHFDLRFEMINLRNWAYSAGKLLQVGDALVVLGRLLLKTLIDALRSDRRLLRTAPGTVGGFVRGLRARRPVRPEVSTVYRHHCVNFANPLTFTRTPLQRLSARIGADDPDAGRSRRRERWGTRSAAYYPRGVADLTL